jgi:predicted DNA-binding transcriptional regulator YafY
MVQRYSRPVRASRLVGLLGLLQARGRMSTTQLARELEVSPRTILRDIEALSSAGIPVYAVRGRLGGFELLEGFTSDLPAVTLRPRPAASGQVQRARIRLSPRGRRLAALLGRPESIRIRHSAPAVPGRPGWVEGWVRVESPDSAVLDLLALGAEVEVLHPPQLRARVADTARRIAELNAPTPGGEVPGPP